MVGRVTDTQTSFSMQKSPDDARGRRMGKAKPLNWKAFGILLVASSVILGVAASVATYAACGHDFIWYLFHDERCFGPIGKPALVWVGSLTSFAIFTKMFWCCVAVWAVWRRVRT